EKGKNKVNKLLKQHNYFNDAGPMWLGSLWDKKLVERMHKIALANGILNKDKELIKFLQAIKHESKINTIGFYDLHYLCKKYKIKVLRKKSEIIEKVKKFGYHASETHFKGEGIRSNMPHKEFISLIRD
ncbi:hypothetical protein HYW99_02735, partial [Candidatus Woesearchaeota archaeon]|nr:hypothetical protein [Candidatus Woesearchaeota archaeon]